MAKSIYKEKILEKLRILHEEEELLYSILDDIKHSGEEEGKEDK